LSITVTTTDTVVQVTATNGPVVAVTVTETPVPIVVTALQQGPAGPTGPQGPSGTVTFTGIAGEDLSGHRIVTVNGTGQYVYCSDIFGLAMTTGAVVSGASVELQSLGEIEEHSWTWTPKGYVYQTGLGQITQTTPTTGFVREIGIALTPTKILLTFQSPITLG
jgi:hypothetical protein